MSDTSPLERALLAIVEVASTHVDLLEDARLRSDVNRAKLAESALDLLLEAIAAHVERLEHDESVSTAGRGALAAFASRVTAQKAEQVHVRQHLIELGEGWMCRSCKADVPSGAVLSGVRKGAPKLELSCARCGRTTPAGKKGTAAFTAHFGHLIRPDWDPRANGFVWSEG